MTSDIRINLRTVRVIRYTRRNLRSVQSMPWKIRHCVVRKVGGDYTEFVTMNHFYKQHTCVISILRVPICHPYFPHHCSWNRTMHRLYKLNPNLQDNNSCRHSALTGINQSREHGFISLLCCLHKNAERSFRAQHSNQICTERKKYQRKLFIQPWRGWKLTSVKSIAFTMNQS